MERRNILPASHRLFRAVVLQFITLLMFAVAVGVFIPLKEFISLEEQFLSYQEDRVGRLLIHEGEELISIAEDWAHWTETWHYMRGENPEYTENNLDLDTVLNLRLTLFSFVRTDGSVVWQMETDLREGIEISSPCFPAERFPDWIFSFRADSSRQLIALIGERKLLMVATPVLKNDDSGESPGILVIARELDEAAVADLSELTQVDFSLLNESEIIDSLSDYELRRLRETGRYLRKSRGRLYSFMNLEVLSDRHALLVQEVRLSRTIMDLGMRSFGLYLLVSVVGLLVMALILLRYIRRSYIDPVSTLYWDLQRIREEGDLSFRMTVSGEDEFSQFRRGFNELLEVIEEQTAELTNKNLALREEADRDGLTGLYNKRYFRSRLESFSRSSGERRELSLMMMDIDHFKMYNDRYGHIAGDGCIRNVAGVLGRVVTRPADICARYGGEEFVILLEDTGRIGAEMVAGKILSQVEALDIENADSPVAPHLTVSIGIAWGRPSSPEDLEALLHEADKALYASKKGGRNRFSFGS